MQRYGNYFNLSNITATNTHFTTNENATKQKHYHCLPRFPNELVNTHFPSAIAKKTSGHAPIGNQ